MSFPSYDDASFVISTILPFLYLPKVDIELSVELEKKIPRPFLKPYLMLRKLAKFTTRESLSGEIQMRLDVMSLTIVRCDE